MSRSRWFFFLLIPLALAFTTYLAVAAPMPEPRAAARPAARPAVPTPGPSDCVAGLTKSVDRSVVPVGAPVEASLGVSMTCGVDRKPVDLVLVVDESYSMTRGGNDIGQPTEEPTPDPKQTPVEPTSDPGGGIGDEPAWCRGSDGIGVPTATPTRWFWRTPTPGGGGDPTEVPQEAAGREDLIRAEKNWVQDFLSQPEIQRDMASDRLRMGFVSFAKSARVKKALSNSPSNITTASNQLRANDLSKVDQGLREADRILNGSGKRPDDERQPVIVLLSDFDFCKRDMKYGGAGSATKLVTVGFGRDLKKRNMIDMASDRAYALEQRDMKQLIDLYERVIAPSRPITVTQLTVRDNLSEGMRILPDSVMPPVLPPTVTLTGQLLEWQLNTLPAQLSYRVEPQDAGLFSLSTSAEALWTDSVGRVGSALFPDVQVEVVAFTPTPTSTDTPTATPTDTPTPTPTFTPTATSTPVPKPKYLPILYRVWPEPTPACVPEEQTIDVALIIDTSDSMQLPTQPGGQLKIDAAIEAALEIVQLLKPNDQATIIGFNNIATMTSELSGDKAKLTAAVRALPGTHGSGTAIDAGIQMATQELLSSRHQVNNTQSMILVTDGAQSVGTTQQVIDAANVAKDAGITIVTVGLGESIDEGLLRVVASSPDLYFPAPNAEDLVEIYREIARLIPCP